MSSTEEGHICRPHLGLISMHFSTSRFARCRNPMRPHVVFKLAIGEIGSGFERQWEVTTCQEYSEKSCRPLQGLEVILLLGFGDIFWRG